MALRYFFKCLEFDAQMAMAHFGIGLIHFAREDWEQAQAFLNEGNRLRKGETDPEICNAVATLAAMKPQEYQSESPATAPREAMKSI